MNINLNIRFQADENLLDLLQRVVRKLDRVENLIMGQYEDLDAIRVTLDANTTTIGGIVTALRDQVRVGMTQEQVDTLKASFTKVGDDLVAIGKDPGNLFPELKSKGATAGR